MKQLFAKRTLLDRLMGDEEINAEINQKTIAHYRKKLRTLAEKTAAHLNAKLLDDDSEPKSPEQVSFQDMSDYLHVVSESGDLSHSYISKFRSALLYHIYEKAKDTLDEGGSIEPYTGVYDSVRNMVVTDSLSASGRTNSQSRKFFDQDFYEYCIATLSKKRRMTAAESALLHYLQANVHLGLRPHEWMHARACVDLSTGSRKNVLVVENSKNSNERANGEYRELMLHQLPAEALKSASALIAYYVQTADQYKTRYGYDQQMAESRAATNIQKNLNVILHKLGKTYAGLRPSQKDAVEGTTLYSLRHQAIANAKAAEVDDVDVAAMFGHVSIRTSKEYYGRKSFGWGGKFLAQPTMNSLIPVIERLEQRRGGTKKYVADMNPDVKDHLWSMD